MSGEVVFVERARPRPSLHDYIDMRVGLYELD